MKPLVTYRRNPRSKLVAMLIGLSLGIVGIAQAEPLLSDDLASEFKARGDKAIAAGDYAAAVEAYRKGDKIQHHPVFDYNLARALQGLGHYADALDELERFTREASPELTGRVPNLPALIQELRSNVGTVVLEGEPHAARVRGNESDLGSYVPGRKIRCNVGPLELQVLAEGFAPIHRHLRIEAEETVSVALKFEHNDERAILTIRASAVGARVTLDGRNLGQTPLETKLNPGSHRLKLEHADYDTLETDLVVSARERRSVSYDLPQRPKLWSKWWFWSGAAAVLAGVVVAGVALSTSKSATPGDIQPGVISAPLVSPR